MGFSPRLKLWGLYHYDLKDDLLNLSHSKHQSAIALLGEIIHLFLNPLGHVGVTAQRRELILSPLGKDKLFPIIYTLDNNAHHFAVTREFEHLKDLIFFLLAIELDLDGI